MLVVTGAGQPLNGHGYPCLIWFKYRMQIADSDNDQMMATALETPVFHSVNANRYS